MDKKDFEFKKIKKTDIKIHVKKNYIICDSVRNIKIEPFINSKERLLQFICYLQEKKC